MCTPGTVSHSDGIKSRGRHYYATTVQWIRTVEDENYFKRSSLKAEVKAKGSARVEADAGAEVGAVEWPREIFLYEFGRRPKDRHLETFTIAV